MPYVLLVIFTVAIAAANLVLRVGLRDVSRPGLTGIIVHSLRTWTVWLGGLLYAGSTVLWLIVLEHVDLGLAYPVYIGGSFALVYLCSFAFLKERFDWPSMCGAVLVFAGIVIAA
jgi:multidrug transporter EmrE-like cation transporter